jgi:hypothetical protein
MTPQEQAEIDFRSGPLERAASDPPLVSYLDGTPDFAGKYIDHQLGGKLVVLFTANIDQHVGTLTQLFPYHDRLVVRSASHSMRTLQGLQQQVDADTPSLDHEGVSVAVTGVDVPHNQVNVTVTHLDKSVRAVFAARYGKDAPITLSEGPFARREGGRGTDAPPFRGGQELDRVRASDQTVIICTSGYVIRQYTGGLTSPYTYWLTTAGHCGPAGVQWTQGGFLVGNEQLGTYGVGAYSSNSDVAIIPIPSLDISNQVMRYPGVYDLVPYGQSKDGDNAGDTVCLSGTFSGYNCSTLQFTNQTVTFPPDPPEFPFKQQIFHLRYTSTYISKPGDSGGSWYNPGYRPPNGLAVGTHVGCYCNVNSIYAQIGWDFSDLNLALGGSALQINSDVSPLGQ